MVRLFSIIYSLAGSALAGSGVVMALSTGHYGAEPILIGAAAGALLAVPLSWLVARRLLA
ncbi:hypothetical protein [Phaeovulum sp. W22_SRMD_FR3]|uniref:hypothetical protein n=1 Tax=Phaeovulum sp. W22_SRMD_FR3 TaxID=3240274 RepID=UPI003F9AA726